jgi:hypothetical protein
MKYQLSFLIVLMLVHLSCSQKRVDPPRQQPPAQREQGATLSLGMRHELALEIIGGMSLKASSVLILRLSLRISAIPQRLCGLYVLRPLLTAEAQRIAEIRREEIK